MRNDLLPNILRKEDPVYIFSPAHRFILVLSIKKQRQNQGSEEGLSPEDHFCSAISLVTGFSCSTS
jgi:hypothetical protein